MKVNCSSDQMITVEGSDIKEVESFSYLGSVKQQLRTAFYSLKKIWSSRQITRTITKIRIFNTNVKSVLLYEAKTWRIAK